MYRSVSIMTITDHISETVMQSFCAGGLPAISTLLCAEHIEVCRECSRLFERLSRINAASAPNNEQSLLQAYLLGEHLIYEQLSAYLDRRLDKDEMREVKLHLEFCPDCSEELSGLKEFRRTVESELRPGPWRRLVKTLTMRWEWIGRLDLEHAFGILSILILSGLTALMIHQWHNWNDDPPPTTPTVTAPGNQPPIVGRGPIGKVDQSENPSGVMPPKSTETIFDGHKQYVIAYEGDQVRIDSLTTKLQKDVVKLLKGQVIGDPRLLQQLASANLSLRGANKSKIVLLNPVGTVIEEERPVLRWGPIEGATSYLVDLTDETLRPVAQSPHVESTEWTVTDNLKRGAVYLWQVTGFKNGERIDNQLNPMGRFMVASEKKAREIEEARKQYTDHLELGVYYLKEGLLDQAQEELSQLRLRNPDSKIVNKMWRNAAQIHRR